MKGFNKVILMGNLTRDPETRTTPGGQSVTQFSLAVNRTWKGADGQQQEAVSFIDCVAWGKAGEIIPLTQLRPTVRLRLTGPSYPGRVASLARPAAPRWGEESPAYTSRDCSMAAAMKLENSGCGSNGRLLSSG